MQKKILIVGVSSFIGSHLAVYLRDKAHLVYGTYAYHLPRLDKIPTFKLIIGPHEDMRPFIDAIRPDVVIYCSAITNVEECKKNPVGALYLHSQAPATMAEHLKLLRSQFIYLSTSKVFSGEKGCYSESDTPDPQGVYGKSKLNAEKELKDFQNTTILRLGTLFGIGSLNQNSMFNRIFLRLLRGEHQTLIDDEFRSFISADELARCIEAILLKPANARGIFHIGNTEEYTYYTFTKRIAEVFRFQNASLGPISGREFNERISPRAESAESDLRLNSLHFEKHFNYSMPTVETQLKMLQSKFETGRQ